MRDDPSKRYEPSETPARVLVGHWLRVYARDLSIRALISLVVGLIVVAGTLDAGARANRWVRILQIMTRSTLLEMDGEIRAYRANNGKLPPDLAVLEGFRRDAWDRPLIYTVRGESYALSSLGADGLPGGVGLDSDLTPGPPPSHATPTLAEFLAHPSSAQMIRAAWLAGTGAFGLTLWTIRRQGFGRGSLALLSWRVALTLVGTLTLSMWLIVLHVPSGH
jgi:hypothetical protein